MSQIKFFLGIVIFLINFLIINDSFAFTLTASQFAPITGYIDFIDSSSGTCPYSSSRIPFSFILDPKNNGATLKGTYNQTINGMAGNGYNLHIFVNLNSNSKYGNLSVYPNVTVALNNTETGGDHKMGTGICTLNGSSSIISGTLVPTYQFKISLKVQVEDACEYATLQGNNSSVDHLHSINIIECIIS